MRNAFTLVELVVVVLILGILAAVAAPRFFSYSEDANVNTLMRSMIAIAEAAEFHYADTGAWPSSTGPWNAPGDFEGYIADSAMTRSSPFAVGEFKSNAVVRWEFVPTRRRIYYPHISRDIAEKCDEQFDDGNSSTGSIKIQYGTSGVGTKHALISYYMHEG